jgi:hypothetical protein
MSLRRFYAKAGAGPRKLNVTVRDGVVVISVGKVKAERRVPVNKKRQFVKDICDGVVSVLTFGQAGVPDPETRIRSMWNSNQHVDAENIGADFDAFDQAIAKAVTNVGRDARCVEAK